MKILMVSAELAGLAAVGGVAEYCLGLASALLRKGHDVRVAVPAYAFLRSCVEGEVLNDRLVVQLGVGMSELTSVHELGVPCPGGGCADLPVVVLGEHKHLAAVRSPGDIYRWPNHEPWIAFSRSVVDLLGSHWWQPDVVHCQDSHTALIPVYVKQMREQRPSDVLSKPRTVLTLHNLLNQGLGAPDVVAYAGLPDHLFHGAGFEYYGEANSMKAGLLAADRVSTVSRTYAEEICQSREYGFGLQGVLRGIQDTGRLTGILNGIDNHRWFLNGLRYDGTDRIESVQRKKKALRERVYPGWGWKQSDEPVIAFRGRWDHQKGVSVLGECLERILDRAKLTIVSWGTETVDPELRNLWERFTVMAAQRPDRLLINPESICKVSEVASHYTIADFFLMPSTYEPCGLMQMECQRYGTVPIVRHTGGLADTVSEKRVADLASPNGFVFQGLKADALLAAVQRAVEAYRSASTRAHLMQNALLQQNGWETRVSQYEELFGMS